MRYCYIISPRTRQLSPSSAYPVLLAATTISSLGDGLAIVAFPLLAATLFRDAWLVAGLFLAQNLPWLILSLPAGALADRWSPRRVMVASDLARCAAYAVTVALLTQGRASAPALLAAALVAGTGDIFFNAAANSLLPRLLTAEQLASGNGQLSASMTVGEQLLGPILGGLAFASRRSLPFFANAASFAVSASLLYTLPALPPAARGAKTTIRADMVEAMRFFRTTPLQRRLTSYVTLAALGQGVVYSISVLYAREALGLGARGYGFFLTVAALGAVAGGLLAGWIATNVSTTRIITASGALSSAAFLIASLTSLPSLAAALWAIQNLCVIVGNVTIMTVRQLITPAHLRGRVANLHRTFVYGSAPFAAIIGGATTQLSSARMAVAVGGAIQLVAVIYAIVGVRPAAAAADLASLRNDDEDETSIEDAKSPAVAGAR